MYEVPNRTAPNWTALSQTKSCITKSLCEICSEILRSIDCQFYTDISGQPISRVSRVKKFKRESREKLKLTDKIFFFGGFVHRQIFLKKHVIWKSGLFLFIGKRAPNLVDTLIELFSIIGHYKNSSLIRYATQDRYSSTPHIPGSPRLERAPGS